MIKCENGDVYVDATQPQMLGEFSTIAKAIREKLVEIHGKEKGEALLDEAYEDSKKTPEELLEDILMLMCKKMIERKEKANGRDKDE